MFQTGSQINPALGRIDYSAYTQGALAGGQSIGQGIANLGQSIARGIEAYNKKKEENKKIDDATSVVSNLVKSDPKIAAFLNLKRNESGEHDDKAIRSSVKTIGAGPILQLALQNQEFNRTQENESRTAQAALAFSDSGMGPVIPENRAAVLKSQGFTPQQIAAGQAYALNLQAKQAEIAETRAKTAAAGVGRPVMTLMDAQAEANAMAEASGKDFMGKTLYDEKTGGYTPSIVQKSPAAFASPEEEAAKEASKGLIGRINKQAEEESAYAPNAQQILEEITSTRQALAEGAVVGAGQNAIDSLIGVFARLPVAGEYFEKLKGNQDVLKRNVSSFAIDSAQRIAGQGQVTDTERKLTASTVPQNTDSRVGFEFGLGFMQAAVERRQKYAELLEDTQARLSSGELTASEAARITNRTKFYKDNPIDVKGIYEMAKNSQNPAPAAAGGGINPSPTTNNKGLVLTPLSPAASVHLPKKPQ